MSSIYTEKWVLFLDILGFEAYIKDEDEKKSEEFAGKVLPLLEKLLRQNILYTQKKSNISQQYSLFDDTNLGEISQFSDTFVISSQSLDILKNNAIHIQNALLKKGLISRGAITYGKVFHKSSQFIGPAITRAYNLEKSEALYPRVIIDPECEGLRENRLEVWDTCERDFDGYHYINFLEKRQEFGDTYSRLLLLNKCFINIEKLYEKYKNTPHRGKYTWLKQKADEFVQNTK